MTSKITLPLKLAMLGLVPLGAIAGLSTWRVVDDFDEAATQTAQADEVRRVDQIGRIIDEVDEEVQMLNEIGASEDDLTAQRSRVDAALNALLDDPNGASQTTLDTVEAFRSDLEQLRSTIPSSPSSYRLSGAAAGQYRFDHGDGGIDALSPTALEIVAATEAFETFVDDLSDATRFEDDLFRDGGIAADVSTLQLFDRLSDRLADERQVYVEMATLPASFRTDEVLEAGREAGRATESWKQAVGELGVDDMLADLAQVSTSPAAQRTDDVRGLMAGLVPGQPLSMSAADIEEAFVDFDTQLAAMRSRLAAETIGEVDAIRSAAVRSAYVTMALAALFVGIAGALIYLLYLSIRRPLRRVTKRSIEVASVQLPAAVATLRENADAELPEIEPIEVESRDEIGQLVDAFNTMSATSLALAGEQAIARRSVGDMFMNLGRRNQKLLNRLLRNLDQLQRDEREPEALQALYEIDHLTTRMRRNAESLLILAGAEQTRRFSNPAAAGDIIRGAMSEVENYERVEILGDTGQRIRGELVADLTHLLAELIENGLAFSPPDTTVQVTARMTHRGYMFAVSDDGVGMTPAKIEEANQRISQAATQEETPSKFLGLFVVGRLAARRDVDVKMFDSPTGGVVVRLALPDSGLYVESDAPFPAEDAPALEQPATPAGHHDTMQADTVQPDTVQAETVQAETVQAEPSPKPALPTPTASGAPVAASAHDMIPPRLADSPTDAPAESAEGLFDSLQRPLRVGSLDDVPADRRPAVRAALESIERIASSPAPFGEPRDPMLADPAQPLTAPVGAAMPAPPPTEPKKFGGVTRRPGANLPKTTLGAPDQHDAEQSAPAAAADAAPSPQSTPDGVRHSLSGFQSGTSRADRQGAEQ